VRAGPWYGKSTRDDIVEWHAGHLRRAIGHVERDLVHALLDVEHGRTPGRPRAELACVIHTLRSFRRIATRHEKTARNYFACVLQWLIAQG
jgi:hypothetical protein